MSYWLKKKEYDVLIKGGGIAGISTAFHLLDINPYLKIAIHEKNHIGYGATGRNAGFLTCGSINYLGDLSARVGHEKAKEIWKAYIKNHQMLKEYAGGADYERCGATTWAVDQDEADRLDKIVEEFKDFKFEEVKSDRFLKGWKNREDASIHPVKLLRNLVSQLNSVDFLYGDNIEVKYHVLVNAMNGYSENSLISPKRGQVILYKGQPKILDSLGYNTKNLVYFKQLPTGEVLIGGARTIDAPTEDTRELGTNEKIVNHLKNFGESFLGLNREDVMETWSGIMGFTKDHQPLVGKLKEKEYIIAGFSGHGMGISFFAAKKLAENILRDGKIPDWMDVGRYDKK